MEKSWRAAIIKVLNECGSGMHYSDITEQILSKQYYQPDGATPAATVNALIASSIKSEGSQSPFVRVSPGVFSLNTSLISTQAVAIDADIKQIESESQRLINAFGMYWQRELIIWKKNPNLFGRSPGSTMSINFAGQRGIYLLYDHHTPVYVGRTTDQAIGQRLLQHTLGRLAGRWNRFSWFGICAPTNEGKLLDANFSPTETALITAFEALLIEVLEPPQNRRQGDGLAGCEYIQDIDPGIKKQQIAATLHAIEQKLISE